MPFLSKDWRSPGDQWVRTKQGWEKLRLWRVKVFERLNENIFARLLRLATSELSCHEGIWKKHQPCIHYIKGISRERKVLTSLTEAFIHLDMTGAARDLRRFNYVKKMLELLLDHKLINMSGSSQKQIIAILEEMIDQVLKTENNVASMRVLLNSANNTLNEGKYHHIGSTCLWERHQENVGNMLARLNNFTITPRKDDGKAKFEDLPEDCVRQIFERLSDHCDIIHTGCTNKMNHRISSEMLLWKRLCFHHFTDKQILTFLPQEVDGDVDFINWQYIYHRCFKRFGQRETYADSLAICCNCDTIFWKSIGHPCVSEEDPVSQILSPEAFIKLFNL
ncbi:hypothetical protein FSP39_022567 [Pinctada imbricata]|uniref:F-box domain-containing protein n=1 Tax=Pinctada imbricata TaxID=66713 RepID=A0AA89BUW9_PINIB|nr:hypothetical protein FSP39_022567 [Pinctada imbricata]